MHAWVVNHTQLLSSLDKMEAQRYNMKLKLCKKNAMKEQNRVNIKMSHKIDDLKALKGKELSI